MGPLKIEAKAMEVGVLFAWDVGIREVIFECDSKIVSNALLGLCTPPVIISNFMHFLQIPPKYIYKSPILEDTNINSKTKTNPYLDLELL